MGTESDLMNVLVVQPRMTRYRAPLVQAMRDEGHRRGVNVKVVAGKPTGRQKRRSDDASDEVELLRELRIPIGPSALRLRSLGFKRRHMDLTVLTHGFGNLECWPLVIRNILGGRSRFAWWGHGRVFVNRDGGVKRRIRSWLTRRAHWYFVYTEAGANALIADGFLEDRITIVQNSTDTRRLAKASEEVPVGELAEFIERWRLTRGSTALFLGSLDPSKELARLLEVGQLVSEILPDWRCVVVGDGPLRSQVEHWAANHSWLVYLGSVQDDRGKALVGRASDYMLIPGRVGLVATDAFALRTPIITAMHDRHAPEFEYLRNGVNAIVAAPAAQELAVACVELSRNPQRLEALQKGCRASSEYYSIEECAVRFIDGVIAAQGKSAAHHGPRRAKTS